ncbi:MAG: PorT family protein [Bacteroidales bacterium]|nr:PorT family protein [Bacteroidales bacterium]
MKRIVFAMFVAAFCCGVFPVVHAQSDFSFGIKAGCDFSNYISKSNLEPGGEAGIFFRIGKGFYFQPEVLYAFRSSTFEDLKVELENNFKVGEHYIDFPLLLGGKVVNNENFNLRLFIGPRIGVRVAATNDKLEDVLGMAQWGGQAGIGIDFWRFTLDVKYDISATKFKNAASREFWLQNIFNVALGFKFKK